MDDNGSPLEDARALERAGKLSQARERAQDVVDPIERLLLLSRINRQSVYAWRNDEAVSQATAARDAATTEPQQTRAGLALAAAYAVRRDHERVAELVGPLLHDPPMGWAAGQAWFLIGTIRDQQADYPNALGAYQRALAAYGSDPDLAEDITIARGAEAGVLDRLGRSLIAAEMYARAGAHWASVEVTQSRGKAIWLLNSAIVTRHLGRYVEAAEDAHGAAEALGQMEELQHAAATARANEAVARMALGQLSDAGDIAAKATRALRDECPDPHPRLADLYAIQGNCHASLGDLPRAAQDYAEAERLAGAGLDGRASSDVLRFRVLRTLATAENSAAGSKDYSTAIQAMQGIPGLEHDEALARVNFGLLIAWNGDLPRAERNYRLALEQYAGLEGTERSAARCRVYLAYVLYLLGGRDDEALAEAMRAAEFLNADRYAIKSHGQRREWSATVVSPAFRLAMHLAAAAGRTEDLARLIILSRAQGVRLSAEHYADKDWGDRDLPLGPLPTLVGPSDNRVINGPASPDRPSCYFM